MCRRAVTLIINHIIAVVIVCVFMYTYSSKKQTSWGEEKNVIYLNDTLKEIFPLNFYHFF